MKNKNIFILSLIVILVLNPLTGLAKSDTVKANGSVSKLIVNGKEYKVEAYNIGGNNYFKLRDLALVLDETDKSFSIDWNEKSNTINIITGERYTKDGSELKLNQNIGKANAKKTVSNILFNGSKFDISGYNIKYNNYFKLRDICSKLNIFVDYNDKTKAISIDSKKAYVEEAKSVAQYNLDKYKKDIVNKKYGKENVIVDIIAVDIDQNNKPYVVALVSDGKNKEKLKMLFLDNGGKLINTDDILIYEGDTVKIYPVDSDFREGSSKLEKAVDMAIKSKDGYVSMYGYEYYENKLSEYKFGTSSNVNIDLLDNYKIELEIDNDKFVYDISDNKQLIDVYYKKDGTPYEDSAHAHDFYKVVRDVWEEYPNDYNQLSFEKIDASQHIERNLSPDIKKHYNMKKDFLEGRKYIYNIKDNDFGTIFTIEVIEYVGPWIDEDTKEKYYENSSIKPMRIREVK